MPKQAACCKFERSTCGGCPGGNAEYVPEEFKKNGVDVIHLATGLVVGYPPCPWIRHFKNFIETQFNLPVVVGTHPIPLKCLETHPPLRFWEDAGMSALTGDLIQETRDVIKHTIDDRGQDYIFTHRCHSE